MKSKFYREITKRVDFTKFFYQSKFFVFTESHSSVKKFREINFATHSVEKVGILLSRFLRKNWEKFRENKTNAKLAQFT